MDTPNDFKVMAPTLARVIFDRLTPEQHAYFASPRPKGTAPERGTPHRMGRPIDLSPRRR